MASGSLTLPFRGYPQSTALRSLSLSKTKLSDRDGAAVCSALENNTALKQLDLSHNDLGEKAAHALGQVRDSQGLGGVVLFWKGKGAMREGGCCTASWLEDSARAGAGAVCTVVDAEWQHECPTPHHYTEGYAVM